MAMKIYTKTGDQGKTCLIGGTKIPKSHIRIETYGNTDELMSYIGLCIDLMQDTRNTLMLREIQDRLFTIGSSLACDPEKEPGLKIPDLNEEDVRLLEQEIDRMNAALPRMRFFILPGGHATISHLHIARCICRRAERSCVLLHEQGEYIDPLVIQYLNRLSDYIFILARFTGQQLQVEEIPWKPRVAHK